MDSLDTNNKFKWFAGGNAPLLFPTELVTGSFLLDDLTKINIPESLPFATAWGKAVATRLLPNNVHPVPKYILIAWLSIVEGKFYAVADELPKEQLALLLSEKDKKTKKPLYDTLIAGMAPYGKLAIWLSGNDINTEVAWLQGSELDMKMKDFAPDSNLSREQYAAHALAECKEACEKFRNNGLPDPLLFEQYMQKFNYNITPKFEKNAELDKIELFYYNGELNTTPSGEHAENKMRAKPRKIALHWNMEKKQYSGYFWTDEEKIMDTFKNCYGDDTQKEGNLTIQVEASNKQFQFFLQNNDILVEIPAEDMQYIIFKNKFEFHRSKNYNKSKGGWKN